MTARTVLVTGGTRGIGLALAEGFVLAGARVVVASRKSDACERAAEYLRGLGGDAIGVPTHLGDLDDLGALVRRTVDVFGGIDVVVNNAANPLAQPLGQMSSEALTKSYDVNVRGPVFLVQEALPHLKASEHAAVLNMVSIGAFIFSPMLSIYSSAKAAMMSFTRSMAAEFAPFDIRVNALAPTFIETPMTRPFLQDESFRRSVLDKIKLGRLGQVEDLMGAIVFLASDASALMTGTSLLVDGGWTAE